MTLHLRQNYATLMASLKIPNVPVERAEGGVEQVMAQFKGAQRQKKAIASHLESLEALGILLSSKEEGAICWYYAELQKAG